MLALGTFSCLEASFFCPKLHLSASLKIENIAEIQQYLIIIKLMEYILDEIINFQYEKQLKCIIGPYRMLSRAVFFLSPAAVAC